MRRFLLSTCLLFCIIGIPAPVSAQDNDTAARAKIAAILGQFPDGEQGLADAIAEAVEVDPSLARLVVQAALTATPAQQSAIGAGLAEAAAFFAHSDTASARAAQEQIAAAMATAPVATLTAYGGGAASLMWGSGATLTTDNCVSRSRPGKGC
jgi:hypothetical protein